MAKDKKYKLEKDDIEKIEIFKNCINDFVLQPTNRARFVDYSEIHTKENYCLIASVDYDKFKAEIIFYPMYLLNSNTIDLKLRFAGDDCKYSIYDVFNVLDIQDFKQYYYSECDTEQEIKIAVADLFDTIDKYYFDISSCTGENLQKLKDSFEADWNAVCKDDSWKEDIKEDFYIDIVHPFFTNASDENPNKVLKRLQKKNSKGKLDTFYEKRLLKYLEQGNEFNQGAKAEKKVFDKAFAKKRILIISAIGIVCAVFYYCCNVCFSKSIICRGLCSI